MTCFTRLSVLAAILLPLGVPVLAAKPTSRPTADAPAKGQRWLQRLDKDGDGKLSPAEREQARRRMQGSAGRGKQMAPDQAVPAGAKVLRDVEYARVGDKSLKLDIYLPPNAQPDKPLPVIMWIHGGGWQAGSKNGCPVAGLCAEGYAVVSVDYRLTDVAPFPAQIQDCKAAVRWVRAQASKYGFDPKHIGVAGASAGGHLVALLGTSGGMKELEGDVGGNTGESSRVQAVCDFCGPADFTGEWKPADTANATETEVRGHKALDKLLGGPLSENREKARLASPTAHVSKDDPPFLIVHGDEDPLVPPTQSQRLAAALEKAGVPVKLHMVKGGGHGVVSGPTVAMAREFFDKHLKNTK